MIKRILFIIVLILGWSLADLSFPFLYESGKGKRAIVVGATAGMGRETARRLMADGYIVGCVGRRQERLDELAKEFKDQCLPFKIDMSHDDAIEKLNTLIDRLGGCDLMVISISQTAQAYTAGNYKNRSTRSDIISLEREEINLDCLGFWRAAIVAWEHFKKQKSGHLVGVSSTSGLIGAADSPGYCASKAFMQRYMESLRNFALQNKLPIYVTDIIPGYVDVDWAKPGEDPKEYWSSSVEKAGQQIFDAIKSRKKVAFITKRWRIISWLYIICPNWIYNWGLF
ncbi:SDR family NAD(P)-dependent oxidoreductase [Candidatus Dependentiae bacterium]|nr:SDR family NAD(P)-dependent oxidoreductase [Candidatus Dependentiae bacterium]